MKYDVIIIGAGPGGIFAAYELMKKIPIWTATNVLYLLEEAEANGLKKSVRT